MSSIKRRHSLAAGVLVAVALTLGACTHDGGSKTAFCRHQPELAKINLRIKQLAPNDLAGAKREMAAFDLATQAAVKDAPASLQSQMKPMAAFWLRFDADVQKATSTDELRRLNTSTAADRGDAYSRATAAVKAYVSRNCTAAGGTK